MNKNNIVLAWEQYFKDTPLDEVERIRKEVTGSDDNIIPAAEALQQDIFDPNHSILITTEFVSVDIAIILKELGFKIPTLACYELYRNNQLSFATPELINLFGGYTDKILYIDGTYPTVLAPLHSQVLDWLLTVHNIKIFIDYNLINDKYYYGYKFIRPNGIIGSHWKSNENEPWGWNSVKEATIAAIEGELKILKIKNEQKHSNKW